MHGITVPVNSTMVPCMIGIGAWLSELVRSNPLNLWLRACQVANDEMKTVSADCSVILTRVRLTHDNVTPDCDYFHCYYFRHCLCHVSCIITVSQANHQVLCCDQLLPFSYLADVCRSQKFDLQCLKKPLNSP